MKKGNISIFIPHSGCPHDCSFCDQKAISGASHSTTSDEVVTLLDEQFARYDKVNRKNIQIAFFGGSFTAIDRAYMLELLECTLPYTGEDGFDGIRVSTRPDYIDDEILTLLKKYRVKAIELGAQSLCDEVLIKNNRGHSSDDVKNASKLIKKYGFSLGLQMMTGLYGDDDEKSLATARQIIELAPSTVRIYPTVVLKKTYLASLLEGGVYKPQTVEEAVMLCSKLIPMFEKARIRVIRVGLHAQDSLEQNMVGGAYHPSFRELCESEIYLQRLIAELEKLGKGRYEIFVNARDVSKAIGQRRKNILALEKQGYEVKIRASETCESLGTIKIVFSKG